MGFVFYVLPISRPRFWNNAIVVECRVLPAVVGQLVADENIVENC